MEKRSGDKEGRWALETGGDKATGSSQEPPAGTQTCGRLDFTPVRTSLDFSSPALSDET